METTKEYLVKEVEGTPFSVVQQDNNFSVICGKYKFYECADEEEAINSAKTITWDKITALIGMAMEYQSNQTTKKTE